MSLVAMAMVVSTPKAQAMKVGMPRPMVYVVYVVYVVNVVYVVYMVQITHTRIYI
jgi:hypothetical protein